MYSAQVSRSMLGGSNKSADPTQSFNKLAPLILNLITNTIGKGVDTVIGATKASEATVTYFKAIGAGITSMIWTPTDGTLSITGKTRTNTLSLGYERLVSINNQPVTISNQVSVSMLLFPSISRPEYLASDQVTNNQAILMDGAEDGQTKQIILGQGMDVEIVGTYPMPSEGTPISLYLREPGNVVFIVWDNMLKQWFLLNQCSYRGPLKS